MFRVSLIGAAVSFVAGVAFGFIVAAPYITANAPAEWAWLLVPLGSVLAGTFVFVVGWFLTILVTMGEMFRGEFA